MFCLMNLVWINVKNDLDKNVLKKLLSKKGKNDFDPKNHENLINNSTLKRCIMNRYNRKIYKWIDTLKSDSFWNCDYSPSLNLIN